MEEKVDFNKLAKDMQKILDELIKEENRVYREKGRVHAYHDLIRSVERVMEMLVFSS